jgi:hypothetical protein
MRMEEAFGKSVFCDLAGGRLSLGALVNDEAGSGRTGWQDSLIPLYRLFLMTDDALAHQRFMHEYRQLAAKPYYEARQEWEQSEDKIFSGPSGVLTRLLLPALSSCAERAAAAEARRQGVRLAVAMCRYRAEQGQFPEKMENLVPQWMPFVPRDPFDGESMRLKQTERGWVVYSIGPDVKDDGGAAFDRENRTGDITFELPQ